MESFRGMRYITSEGYMDGTDLIARFEHYRDRVNDLDKENQSLKEKLAEQEVPTTDWRQAISSIDHHGNGSFWQNVVRASLSAAGILLQDHLEKRLTLEALKAFSRAHFGDDSVPAQDRFWERFDHFAEELEKRR